MSFGEPLTTLLVVLLSVLLLVRFFQNNQRQKGRLPPGPPALPIIGNILQLDFKAPHKSLIKLSERYGPVFTFWFDSCPAVVVCGAEAMREALIGHGNDFSGRYLIPVIKKVSDGYDCGRKPEHPVETQAIEKVALRILYTDVTSTMLPKKSVPGFRT